MIKFITTVCHRFLSKWFPSVYKVLKIEGDTLPDIITKNTLVYLIDDEESWSVGLKCPCGCGDTLELMLLPQVQPHWSLTIDSKGLPTLYPSIWRKDKCRSHFWIKHGKVYWCQ